MKVVYICEPNCTIHKSLESLVVKKGGYKISTVPLIDVGCIVVFGNTQISTQVLNMIFSKGIDLVFMSSSGLIKGRVLSEKASNIILRIAQFEKWRDDEKKIKIAKAIVYGKIKNQVSMIKEYMKKDKNAKFNLAIDAMENSLRNISRCSNMSELMGIEGAVAKQYFDIYSRFIKGFEFPGRQRRPARDPVNALLNLSYAFLNNEITARLFMYSFDLELGFLHGIRYGRKSLSLDLMEEFRPQMADKFVIQLINDNKIRKDEFEQSEEGCILTSEALKKFCRLFHEYTEMYPTENYNWIKIMDEQVKKFRKCILEGGEYKPYTRI